MVHVVEIGVEVLCHAILWGAAYESTRGMVGLGAGVSDVGLVSKWCTTWV